MTNKVKVPVLDVLGTSTWLRDNPNDFKTWVEGEVAAVLPTLVSGRLLTNNGSTTSWATFVSFFPALQNGKFLTTNGTTISWGTVTPVPDVTGVPNGHVVTRTGAGAVWAAPTSQVDSVTVIDVQIFTRDGYVRTNVDNQYDVTEAEPRGWWDKPVNADPNDLVFVRVWSGGGSGAAWNGPSTLGGPWGPTSKRTLGGFGGNYIERVVKVSQLNSVMAVAVGSGGVKAVRSYNSGGIDGNDGENSSVTYRTGNAFLATCLLDKATSATLTLDPAPSPDWVAGNKVVLYDLPAGDAKKLEGREFALVDKAPASTTNFNLRDESTGTLLDTTFLPSALSGGSFKVAKVGSYLALAYGASKGVFKTDTDGTYEDPRFFSYNGAHISDTLCRGGETSNVDYAEAFATPNSGLSATFGGGAGSSAKITYPSNVVTAGNRGLSGYGGDGGQWTSPFALIGGVHKPDVEAEEPGGGGAGVAAWYVGGVESGAGAPGKVQITVVRTLGSLRGRWDFSVNFPDGVTL